MTYSEHYFENLLYHGRDVWDNANRDELTKETREAIELCADYVINTLFNGRDDFIEWRGQRTYSYSKR